MSTLKKAQLYPSEQPNNAFYVQFNPNTLEYTVGQNSEKKNVEQSDSTGQTGWAELSMTLFFYTYRSENDFDDVRKNINRLRPYLSRRDDKNNVIQPKLTFAWGTITLDGHLEAMRVSYQMFAADGTPVQAEVQITLVGEDRDVTANNVNYAQSMEIKEAEAETWRKKFGFDKNAKDMGIYWLFSS